MLYIFDLGNVIIDIDFNRVLGVWSNFSGIPLATIEERFHMGDEFEKHERGEITDQDFARSLSAEMMLGLSFDQFALGWQAVFVEERREVLAIMRRLREQGHRVVILSNTNSLHTSYWPEKFPQVVDAADRVYLSQKIGMRKPERRIYEYVLTQEGLPAEQAIFFDDNEANIAGAEAVGIHSILVTDKDVIPAYFTS